MRCITLLGLLLTPLACQAVQLNDSLAVQLDLSLVSDYRSRGISQTQNNPAIQAGATLQHASGLYIGTWTSNVDFGYDSRTRQEVDYFAGWYWEASEAVNLDLGYLKYSYPKQNEYNQSEVYAALSVYGVKLGGYYSNDASNAYGDKQDTFYSYLGYETLLPLDVGLKLRYGHMDYKDPTFWSRNEESTNSYNEWEVKLVRDFIGVTWGLSYVDTSLSKTQCASSYGFKDVCSASLIASVSKLF